MIFMEICILVLTWLFPIYGVITLNKEPQITVLVAITHRMAQMTGKNLTSHVSQHS